MMNFPLTCIMILVLSFVTAFEKTILPSDKVAFLNDFLRQSKDKHAIIEDHMCWDHGKMFTHLYTNVSLICIQINQTI